MHEKPIKTINQIWNIYIKKTLISKILKTRNFEQLFQSFEAKIATKLFTNDYILFKIIEFGVFGKLSANK